MRPAAVNADERAPRRVQVGRWLGRVREKSPYRPWWPSHWTPQLLADPVNTPRGTGYSLETVDTHLVATSLEDPSTLVARSFRREVTRNVLSGHVEDRQPGVTARGTDAGRVILDTCCLRAWLVGPWPFRKRSGVGVWAPVGDSHTFELGLASPLCSVG